LGGSTARLELSLGYDLNNAYIPEYDPDFLNFWTITKEQLNIFIGLELFYGNYSEYLIIYLARLDERLGELISLHSQVQKLPQEVEHAMLIGGVSAMEKKMEELESVTEAYNKQQEEVSENLLDISQKVGLPTEDLLEILQPYLSNTSKQE